MPTPEWFTKSPYLPPHAEAGAATEDELLIEVGRVCSYWEQLEHRLMILLGVIAGFHSTEQAVAAPFSAAFRSVISAGGRQDVLKNVAETTISDRPEYEEFLTMMLTIQRLTSLRNKVVHATTSRQQSADESLPWFLSPAASSKDYNKKGKPFLITYRFNKAQLETIRSLIALQTWKVTMFYSKLASLHHAELMPSPDKAQ